MQALILNNYRDISSLALVQAEIPVPNMGEVLIKVEQANIHSEDISAIDGNLIYSKPLPMIPGLEGIGRVVKCGGGVKA